ncbi:hypothetical protein F4X73_14265 [Candidatus Poribacteria bacterium]|nr:hypothetical protein [Candidatus Poribacteria bacterium]MYB65850.1 hypothetical protein [Candidatus Poribacteria bacterium]MYF54970.1 hypothetical protein [Candidatus Poribacteria bacterium]
MRYRNLIHIENRIHILIVLVCIFTLISVSIAQEQEDDQITSESQESDAQEGDEKPEESNAPESQDVETQLEQLKKDLYCPCGCDRMTFEICHCITAERFKKEFRQALMDGQSVEEITAVYLETYGPQFSAVMKPEGINILAFTMPVVILLAIGGIILLVRRQSREYKPFPQQDNRQLSDELQQKIESELEQFKDRN